MLDMRPLVLIVAVAFIMLSMIMTNNYSIYGQNFIKTWGSLGKGEGQFNGPTGIIEDFGGNTLNVVDAGNNRIVLKSSQLMVSS